MSAIAEPDVGNSIDRTCVEALWMRSPVNSAPNRVADRNFGLLTKF